MGVPVPDVNPEIDAVDATAEALLGSLRTIAAPERRKHAIVFNYWLSIRGERQFPPIRDLDPLEISDAGPFSLLFEMIGGGEDAEIRHIGHAIKGGIDAEKISQAPNPSLLSCIAPRLPVVAACRDAFAFEDEFEGADGKIRCWVTLLPFSATGTWIDYVYGFVSLDSAGGEAKAETSAEPEAAGDLAEVLQLADALAEADHQPAEAAVTTEPMETPQIASEPDEPIAEPVEQSLPAEPEAELASSEESPRPGFSAKLFEKLANAGGFYGKSVEMDVNAFEVVTPEEPEESADPVEEPEALPEPEPEAEETAETAEQLPSHGSEEAIAVEPAQESTSTPEGSLQNKLTEVRAKADEARQAKLRANAALYEGLSAAYDFALDAEETPEEYLKLVEAEGLKIQLRSPMKPVAKLAFDGMCDEAAIKQLEAILAWAFEEELPRGSLAKRIEEAGGIAPILSGQARAA